MAFLSDIIQKFTTPHSLDPLRSQVALQDESVRETQREAYILQPGIARPNNLVPRGVGYGINNDTIGFAYPIGAQQGNAPLLNQVTPLGVGYAITPLQQQSLISFNDALIEPGGGLNEQAG